MSCEPGCLVCARLRVAALELVGRGGIEAVSLHDLAKRGGCSLDEVRKHYATRSECLSATYDEVSFGLFLDLASAFVEPGSWEAAVALALRRLLARLAAHPAEARLCFSEVLRGDWRLRRRSADTRQWVVELFGAEHRRRRPNREWELQIELLVGAALQMIAGAVAEGSACELRELEGKLVDLPEVFTPVTV